DTVKQRLAAMIVLVASTRERAILGTVGYQLLAGGEGHIRGMAVRPSWQARGIAQQLLDTVEAELRDRNCSRIRLETTAPLKRAMRFYERNGFRPSGTVTDFFGMPLFEYVKTLR